MRKAVLQGVLFKKRCAFETKYGNYVLKAQSFIGTRQAASLACSDAFAILSRRDPHRTTEGGREITVALEAAIGGNPFQGNAFVLQKILCLLNAHLRELLHEGEPEGVLHQARGLPRGNLEGFGEIRKGEPLGISPAQKALDLIAEIHAVAHLLRGKHRGNILPRKAQKLREKEAAEAAASADPEIDALVAARTEAKKARNFAEADRIRDELKARGIEIMDTPQGSKWRKV